MARRILDPRATPSGVALDKVRRSLKLGAARVGRHVKRSRGEMREALEEERQDLLKMRRLVTRTVSDFRMVDETDANALRRAQEDAITSEGRQAFREAAEAIEEEL